MLLVGLLACSDYELDKRETEPNVASPDILVEPSSLEWPTIGVNCVEEQLVTVSNVGPGPLTLAATYAEGDALSAEMRTDTLASGESLTFTVRFSPTVAGESLGDIIVQSDDPDQPEVAVESEGRAASEGLISDRFTQSAAPVDVLWVIDNSGSMAQEQTRVASAITSFFSWFTTLNLDYHMGVITTDVVNPLYSGRLVGLPAYIDENTVGAESELAEAIAVGTEDMGDESGLAAVELALSAPVVSTENAGFLRPDAHLAIIFLSDEPEFSVPDSAHYIEFLKTLKADPADILVSAIVGDQATGCSNTCAEGPQDAQPGDKYLEVVSAFSGVFGSICTCDLAPTLDEIGLETTRYVRSFRLSEVPTDPAAIAVYVEGEPNLDWSWIEATNEIVFTTPPLNGSEIIVRYPSTLSCE
ncbi:MAG: choice-of-anchor D domain-containing protein [Pseudomonadota bacterium]|nr:choice-of-anchor D domain-containing protein [Pseudomonadota bacterium]